MVSWAKLAGTTIDYYENSVATGRDDYYAGRGESPGRWYGQGAAILGLEGQVAAGELGRMAAGQHPRTGEQLRTRRPSRGVQIGGHDFTFSAPKSVSLLFSCGDREIARIVRDAHEQAVNVALRTLESEAVFTRRNGGAVRLKTAGLTIAAYRHRTSRAGDPQLHTHAVIANCCLGTDGKWGALDGLGLRAFQMTLSQVYKAELRANLYERGLTWGPLDKWAVGELDGIDKQALRHFSKRRVEILAAAAGPSRKERHRATLETRKAKRHVDIPALEREVAATVGDATISRVREALAAPARTLAPVEIDYEHLAGPDGLTQRRNTFNRDQLVSQICVRAPQGIRGEVAFEHADRFLAKHGVRVLERGDALHGSTAWYTTHDLLEAEQARERAQVGRQDERTGIASERALSKGTQGLGLNDGQQRVVEHVFRSGNGVDIVEAAAGTGKTYTAAAIRQVAELDGRRVIGTAPTGRAARELESQAEIESYTIDALLVKLDRGTLELGPRDVLVADEMGMAGTRPAARLERHAETAGCKVIEIRDSKQLNAVLAGGCSKRIHHQLGGLALTDVIRQRDPEECRMLGRLHAGYVEPYLQFQAERGRLHYDATIEQATAKYMANVAAVGWRGAALIAPTNHLARQCNDLVRQERGERGELGRIAEFHGLEVAEGDRVLFRLNDHRGARHLQVSNGDRGTVVAVHGRGVDVEVDNGARRTVGVEYIEAGNLQHGYCGTAHTHQGQTVERTVIAGHADQLYAELAYVACSRARGATDMFVIRDDDRDEERAEIGPVEQRAKDPRAVLLATMVKSGAEELATEQLRDQQEREPELTLTR